MEENPQTGWRRWLPKSRSARNILQLAGGTATGQALVIAVTPVLTRLFTPDDFGVLAVYASLTALIGVVAALRYELALPVADSDDDAVNLAALGIGVVGLVSIATWLGTSLAWESITRWFSVEQLAPYLWMVPVGVALIGLYQVFSFWNIRDQRFGALARTKLWQGGGQAGVQVVAGVLSSGAAGLIVGDVVGRSMGTTNLAWAAWKKHKVLIRRVTPQSVVEQARRFWRFPVFSGSASFFNSAGLRLPALLLAALYGAGVAGWFALSQRILGIPMALVGQSVASVYLSDVARLRREDPSQMAGLYRAMSKRLLLIGLVPSVVLVALAPWGFELVFGEAWRTAGMYTRVLAPMLAVQFVVAPLSQTLNVLERQDVQLVWDVARAGLIACIFWVGSVTDIDALQIIALYSGGMSLMYLVLWWVSGRLLASASSVENAGVIKGVV